MFQQVTLSWMNYPEIPPNLLLSYHATLHKEKKTRQEDCHPHLSEFFHLAYFKYYYSTTPSPKCPKLSLYLDLPCDSVYKVQTWQGCQPQRTS